jgi:hypothetical protein
LADSFKLLGSYDLNPLTAPLSFAQVQSAPINEAMTVKATMWTEMNLILDPAYTVNFGGVTNAHIVILKSTNGKVLATITTADGTSQVVPFDTYWILMSEASPVTALTLTRVAGVETTVRIFLAEQA